MATNLAIDPDLIETALKLSGETTKKAAVTLALKEFMARRWLEENKLGIAAYNNLVGEDSVWSETMRSW